MGVVESFQWKNREATRLSSGAAELVVLTGGGHLASFRLLDSRGAGGINGLWEAGWATLEPAEHPGEELSPGYGAEETRKFIASFTGHALCLDYFGDALPGQRAAGLSLHGEAGILRWNRSGMGEDQSARCRWGVQLPVAGLSFEREIRLRDGESAAYVREAVTNTREEAHAFDWVQHVTFGPPLLRAGESRLIASGGRGITSPLGYGGRSMVDSGREFEWPYAPGAAGEPAVDLREPFGQEGNGLIAGVQLDPGRALEYVLAVNWKLGIGIGYLFRRSDFPWMTVWEENRSRHDAPWNGTTQARGMEFGSCPLPRGGGESVRGGPIFGTPQQCVLAGGETRTARYAMFLFEIPEGVDRIEEADAAANHIVLRDRKGGTVVQIAAAGCASHLMQE